MSDLSHPHDSVIPLSDKDLTVLKSVDQIIATAVEEHDPFVALNYGASMRRAGHTIGLGLAKLVYELKIRWSKSEEDGGFSRDDDMFIDDCAAGLNISTQTAKKYAQVWEYVILEHPALMSKPLEALLLLSAAAKEDQLTDDDWKAVENAPNKAAIREIVRRRRGGVTSSESAIVILIERDGTLKARKGDNTFQPIGMLNIQSKEPVVLAAIERIVNAAGIVSR